MEQPFLYSFGFKFIAEVIVCSVVLWYIAEFRNFLHRKINERKPMPINAQITHVDTLERAIIIYLAPLPGQYKISDGELITPRPPAQNRLIIESPTMTPQIGDIVTGDLETVQISGSGYSFPYKRDGYNKIKQDW